MKKTKLAKTAAEKVEERCRLEASVTKKLFDSFLYSGFTTEQAFELTKISVENSLVEDLVCEYYD